MKYFIAPLAFIILVFIFSEAGYFYIECFRQHIRWDKELPGQGKLLYKDSTQQIYFGLANRRLDNFDSKLNSKEKTSEVVEFKDSSDYYGLFTKTMNMHLLIREKKDTTNKYRVHISGTFDGLCSPQGARERLMLALRQIEFNRMPNQ